MFIANRLGRLARRRPLVPAHRPRLGRTLSLELLEGRTLLSGPDISVLDGAVLLTGGSATPIEIGSVSRGEVGPTRTFTVRNDGDLNLQLFGVTLPAGFTVVEGLKSSFVPRSLDTFTVRLNSAAVGTYSGEILITSNDSDESTFSFVITGTVTPNGPKIIIQDGGTSIVDGTQAAIPFGGVVLGQTGPVRTFTIKNEGNQALTLGNVSIPVGYALTDPLPATLAAHASDTFSIRLLSSSTGAKSGRVTIASNDPDIRLFDFPITGLVTATAVPSITVLDGDKNVTSGISPLYLGKVIKDQTGPSRTFTVRNDGTATLSIADIVLPSGFTMIDGLVSSLDPLATDTFTVQLDSGSYGTPTGEIRIDSNDPGQSPLHFGITGFVVANAPEIRVFHSDDEIMSGIGGPIEFDTVAQGKTGSKVNLFVANIGVKDLTFGSITVPTGFKVLSGLPSTLPPDTFAFLLVGLDAKVPGTRSGQLSFHTNDSDEDPFAIELSGTVVPALPEIAVTWRKTRFSNGSETPFVFGNGVLGQPEPTQTFTVRNEGRAPLTLGPLSLPSGFELVEGLRSTLGPHASDTFTVRLDTTALGEFGGEISLVSDDADENPFSFVITASVTPAPTPEISVLNGSVALVSGDTNAIELGTVALHKKGSKLTLVVRNDGDADLNLAGVDVPAGFVLAKRLPRRLSPQRTATLVLQLDSHTVGEKSGQLTIHSDDSDETAFAIALLGTVAM